MRNALTMKHARNVRGFGLVELMIAMAAGLVVIGALIAFITATAQSSRTNIRSTRMMQELRRSMNLVEREIRRSGYDQNARNFVGTCVNITTPGACPLSNFNSLVISSSSCLIVAYDNPANSTPGAISAGEYHGFRLQANAAGVGVVQTSLAGSTVPNCSDAYGSTNWSDVTDPRIIDITSLNFTQPTAFGGCVSTASGLWLVVQDVLVQMGGQWTDPATHQVTRRAIEQSIRVKNDRVSTTKPSICT